MSLPEVSLNPDRRPIVPVASASTQPATPPPPPGQPDLTARVVWRCPEEGCEWRLNTFGQRPCEQDWIQLGKHGPAHYADRHPGAPLSWEFRVARDYSGELPMSAVPPNPPGDTSADQPHQVQTADSDQDDGGTQPGPVETSVRADLARLGKLEEGVRGTLAQMALRMAQAYDRYPGGDLTKLARLNQELRQTLERLVMVGDDPDGGEAAHLSTPVWDAAQPGAADAGAEGGGGGGEARPAADAAPAADR